MGTPGRDGELVDARHALGRVEEQPLPVERDDLDFDRPALAGQGLERIELVRAEPRDAAEHHDDQRRNRPHDQLEMARELPLGPIEGARVGLAEPEREGGDEDDDRQDDRQHDRQRIDQNEQLGGADGAGRVEHAAARRERRRGERCDKDAEQPYGRWPRSRTTVRNQAPKDSSKHWPLRIWRSGPPIRSISSRSMSGVRPG